VTDLVQPERVLVVPRAVVPDQAGWLGLRRDGVIEFLETVRVHGRFEPRDRMERDPAYKQVIPYLVLRDGPRYFLMRRTRAGGDPRLHDRWSIGVGGHLNPGDVDVEGGLRREWREELVADFEPRFEPIGLLNDDTTDVGSVHLGLVVVADAGSRPVAIRETDKLSGAFVDADEVSRRVDDLETWSRLVFEALEAVRPAAPTGRSAGAG
jgi:predicted NUDIX family phosphoesterase